MVYILLLLYIFQGQVVLEEKRFETVEACQETGYSRVVELSIEKPDLEGIFAGCVEVKAQEV